MIVEHIPHKRCTQCEENMPVFRFSKRSDRGPSSYYSACKKCVAARARKKRASSKKERKKRKKQRDTMLSCKKCGLRMGVQMFVKDPKYPRGYRPRCKDCANARRRAKRKGPIADREYVWSAGLRALAAAVLWQAVSDYADRVEGWEETKHWLLHSAYEGEQSFAWWCAILDINPNAIRPALARNLEKIDAHQRIAIGGEDIRTTNEEIGGAFWGTMRGISHSGLLSILATKPQMASPESQLVFDSA